MFNLLYPLDQNFRLISSSNGSLYIHSCDDHYLISYLLVHIAILWVANSYSAQYGEGCYMYTMHTPIAKCTFLVLVVVVATHSVIKCQT